MEAEIFHAGRTTDRQTDRHDGAKSFFSQFWKRAQKVKKYYSFELSFVSQTLGIRVSGFVEVGRLIAAAGVDVAFCCCKWQRGTSTHAALGTAE
jgi:hypothetical protein